MNTEWQGWVNDVKILIFRWTISIINMHMFETNKSNHTSTYPRIWAGLHSTLSGLHPSKWSYFLLPGGSPQNKKRPMSHRPRTGSPPSCCMQVLPDPRTAPSCTLRYKVIISLKPPDCLAKHYGKHHDNRAFKHNIMNRMSDATHQKRWYWSPRMTWRSPRRSVAGHWSCRTGLLWWRVARRSLWAWPPARWSCRLL